MTSRIRVTQPKRDGASEYLEPKVQAVLEALCPAPKARKAHISAMKVKPGMDGPRKHAWKALLAGWL